MSLLDMLSDREQWEKFYEYKTSLVCPKQFSAQLRAFIDREGYLPVCGRIERGEAFPLPRKSVVSKMSSQKKRIVYTYPEDENTVLKLLTYLILRKYDGLFCDNLYSFRPGRTAKDAFRRVCRGARGAYSYKVDVSNYFNSVKIPRLLPVLRAALSDDGRLYGFLERLLTEEFVLDNGQRVAEEKGIMAGTPLASFYANLFLSELDRKFYERGVLYARYSDDIIVFGETEHAVRAYSDEIKEYLYSVGLEVNPAKESFCAPEEGFTFLGFRYSSGVVDIAPATVKKLKGKMRRKARGLLRWRERNGVDGQSAAKAFIRIFNRKLLDDPQDNELTWSCWFFSVINTTESLREIDRYAADCLRFLISGKRTKSRFNVRYEDLKRLGYRSLVHEYYAYCEKEKDARTE